MYGLTVVRGIEDGSTAVERAANEAQMPMEEADADVLDVEISLPDRPASISSERRLRRARRRLLAARLAVANHTAADASSQEVA